MAMDACMLCQCLRMQSPQSQYVFCASHGCCVFPLEAAERDLQHLLLLISEQHSLETTVTVTIYSTQGAPTPVSHASQRSPLQ